MALRRGDDPVGCEVAVLSAGAIPGDARSRAANGRGGRPTSLPAGRKSPIRSRCCSRRSTFCWRCSIPPISLRAFDAVTFAYLFLGGVGIILFFRDRGWHAGGALVAAHGICARRCGQRAAAAYRPGHQPHLSAADRCGCLARALERSSWRTGARGRRARRLDGDRARSGRAAVALRAGRLRAGVLARRSSAGRSGCARASSRWLPSAVSAVLVAAVPVIMTVLLAARSNRPEVSYRVGGRRLDPPGAPAAIRLCRSVRRHGPERRILGAAELDLGRRLGLARALSLAEHGPASMPARSPFAAVVAFGLIRGLAWAREIRFFTIAAALVLLYALGGYTPAFHLMYDVLPAVALYRRPADATFVLWSRSSRSLPAISCIAGSPARCRGRTRLQRALEIACPLAFIAGALALAHSVVGLQPALVPIVTAIVFTAAAVAVLMLARRCGCALAAGCAWRSSPRSWRSICAGTMRRMCRPALPRERFDALRHDTSNETVRLLKARLAAAAAPDRRDRVELIGIDYHWPNLSLAQGFDHVFGHNPLRLRWFYEATHVGDTVALRLAAHGSRRSIRPTVRPSPICSACDSSPPVCRSRRSIPRSSPATSRSSRRPRTPMSTRIRARCRA